MKIEYKILWIDDNHRHLKGIKKVISDFIKQQEIIPNIKNITANPDWTPDNDKEFIDAIKDIELDMVFIDFNMPGAMGDDLINWIRTSENNYHIPILFYTGEDDPISTLQDKIIALNKRKRTKIIDGIYFSDRDNIADKTINILKSLFKKEESIQRSRGLLMDRVSEIDGEMINSLDLLWKKIPAGKEGAIKGFLIKNIKQFGEHSLELAEKIKNNKFSEVLKIINKKHNTIGTALRTSTLVQLLEATKSKKDLSQKLKCFSNSSDKNCLCSLRNRYAHTTAKELDKEHNTTLCKYIRKETREQLENVKQIIAQQK
ncbi:MAG: response regulator [Elusimicrobia bacterium]|nr:response regulator [Elusimicrobiota bacterium]